MWPEPLSCPHIFPPVPLSHLFPFTSKRKANVSSFAIHAVGFLWSLGTVARSGWGTLQAFPEARGFPGFPQGKEGDSQAATRTRSTREGTASPTPGLSRFPSVSRDPILNLQSRERENVGLETRLLGAYASGYCPHKAYLSIYSKNSRSNPDNRAINVYCAPSLRALHSQSYLKRTNENPGLKQSLLLCPF